MPRRERVRASRKNWWLVSNERLAGNVRELGNFVPGAVHCRAGGEIGVEALDHGKSTEREELVGKQLVPALPADA